MMKNLIDKLNKKGELLIGRSIECDIILEGHTISRKHALISKNKNGTFKIKDLNSSNGTFINGNKIKGDVLSYLSETESLLEEIKFH